MFGLLILAVSALSISTLIAEGEKSDSSKKNDAEKSSCGISAKHTSADSKESCSEADMKACAEKAGMTLEEFKTKHKDHAMKTISIEGMTCGGCENSVKEALLKVEGVNRVVSISHTQKSAVVCVDATKSSDDALVKAVADKGYSAKMIQAVDKAEGSSDTEKSCTRSCDSDGKSSSSSKKEAGSI